MKADGSFKIENDARGRLPDMSRTITLAPRLVVTAADDALRFYESTLGATLGERFADDDGTVVHAELEIGGLACSLTESSDYNAGPDELGGSPVLFGLEHDDVDTVWRRMLDAGSTVVFDLDDRGYGRYEGRLRDPFGHLWIIGRAT